MKRNERKLVMFAAALFVLVLIVRVVPMLIDYYRQGREEIALQQERLERYRNLIVETEQWKENEALKRAEITDLQSWVFEGSDPNLVSSSVQRMVRQVVQNSGVELRQIDVPRYHLVDDWLVVEQDVDFALSQQAILPFLNALQASRPRLQVAAFSINHNRRQFTGSITVVGFSRARRPQPVAAPLPPQPATSDAAQLPPTTFNTAPLLPQPATSDATSDGALL